MTRPVLEGDPRPRIVLVVFAILVIVSTPRGELTPFAAYIPLSALLILTHRVRLSYVAWRCAAASPFLLLASGLLLVQFDPTSAGLRAGFPAAFSVLAKGYAAVLLLAFLTGSASLGQLLNGLRRLGSPESLNLILSMMHRYTHLLSQEYARMERARESRTVGALGSRRLAVYGHQFGALILRSWDRAERVHSAMLARGFEGHWPEMAPVSSSRAYHVRLLLFAAGFLIARLLLARGGAGTLLPGAV